MGSTRVGGRFRVQRKLGAGGFGEVLLCQDGPAGRLVALKLLTLRNADAAARFRREARVTASLSHPHLVRVLDAGVDPAEGAWIAYEFVEGVDLTAARPARPEDVQRWGIQLAEALEVVHRAGVVHRDVKPGNVLVDAAGDARLCDFGIARTPDATVATATGVLLGTPAFMAPELYQSHPVGPASDQFALAATLYVALGGSSAYAREGIGGVLKCLRDGYQPPADLEARARLPRLAAVLRRGLAGDPGQRYPNLEAFARDLDAARTPAGPPAAGPAEDPSGTVLVAAEVAPAPGDRPTVSRLGFEPRPPARGRSPVLVALASSTVAAMVGLWVVRVPPAAPTPPVASADLTADPAFGGAALEDLPTDPSPDPDGADETGGAPQGSWPLDQDPQAASEASPEVAWPPAPLRYPRRDSMPAWLDELTPEVRASVAVFDARFVAWVEEVGQEFGGLTIRHLGRALPSRPRAVVLRRVLALAEAGRVPAICDRLLEIFAAATQEVEDIDRAGHPGEAASLREVWHVPVARLLRALDHWLGKLTKADVLNPLLRTGPTGGSLRLAIAELDQDLKNTARRIAVEEVGRGLRAQVRTWLRGQLALDLPPNSHYLLGLGTLVKSVSWLEIQPLVEYVRARVSPSDPDLSYRYALLEVDLMRRRLPEDFTCEAAAQVLQERVDEAGATFSARWMPIQVGLVILSRRHAARCRPGWPVADRAQAALEARAGELDGRIDDWIPDAFRRQLERFDPSLGPEVQDLIATLERAHSPGRTGDGGG